MADDGLGLEAGEVNGLIGECVEYFKEAAWLMGGGHYERCSIGISHCRYLVEDQETRDVVLGILDVVFGQRLR